MAFGRTQFLYESIKAVAEAGHEILFIGTSKASPEYTRTADDFLNLAKTLDTKYQYFKKPSSINHEDFVRYVEHEKPDVAISVNYPTLISQKVIDSFPHGIINGHMGDLPRYRGNACPNWAIINGEKVVGITLHLMTKELDAGSWLRKAIFALSDESYIADVYNYAEKTIPIMFVEALVDLENKGYVPSEQVGTPLRCYPLRPEDSKINWYTSARHIHRIIRASSKPFQGAFTHFNGDKITVWKAHVEEPDFEFCAVPGQVLERRKDGSVAIATLDDWLVLDEFEPEIIRSNRTRLT